MRKLLKQQCLIPDKLGNDEEEKVSVVGDLESIITYFSKTKGENYSSDNGWLDILQPLLALKMAKDELYNCFYALNNKYITRLVGSYNTVLTPDIGISVKAKSW